MQTHSKIAIGTAALGNGLANVVHEVFLAGASGRADGLLLELDLRHDVRWGTARWAQLVGGVFRSSGGDGEVEEAWGEIGGCRGLGLAGQGAAGGYEWCLQYGNRCVRVIGVVRQRNG
jgi:hypothetical protein